MERVRSHNSSQLHKCAANCRFANACFLFQKGALQANGNDTGLVLQKGLAGRGHKLAKPRSHDSTVAFLLSSKAAPVQGPMG